VWPNRCLTAPFYGHLNHDQMFNLDAHVIFRPPSTGMTSSLAAPTSGPLVLTDEAHGGGATPHT
jgi:hypothetical protein